MIAEPSKEVPGPIHSWVVPDAVDSRYCRASCPSGAEHCRSHLRGHRGKPFTGMCHTLLTSGYYRGCHTAGALQEEYTGTRYRNLFLLQCLLLTSLTLCQLAEEKYLQTAEQAVKGGSGAERQ